MKILLSWLKEFVELPGDVRQVSSDLTQLGLAVDLVTVDRDETVFELDITTNRPDCLSHYGVARELAALYGKPLGLFGVDGDPSLAASGHAPIKPRARRKDSIIEIVDTDLCRRYSARLIRGVKVAPSPEWLSRRLELVGVRSINNIADATNYMLMAYGHPLHAFDLNLLTGGKIVVRRAKDGEMLTTLDGAERKLTSVDLVIADAKRPVALAGIMGGKNTEISDATIDVLIESAWFEPFTIRRTAKREGLHTEASHRFERGADIGAMLAAANRCAELIQQLAGGVIDEPSLDAYARPEVRKPIVLRRTELTRHLGMEPPPEETAEILSRLGFVPVSAGKSGWKCTAPTYRVDVTREIDLVEEVARHFGYDKFPTRLPGMADGRPAQLTQNAAKEKRLRNHCLGLGYDETISMVLVSQATASYGAPSVVQVANPLSEEAGILRNSLVPGLLASVQWNVNRGADTVRLFELGSIYLRDGERFAEPPRLATIATGDRIEASLSMPAKAYDFLDLKGDVEQLASLFQLNDLQFDSEGLPEYYRSGHSARLCSHEKTIAWFGELSREEAAKWKFRKPVFLAEYFLDALYEFELHFPRVRPISRFPAVERDFSVLLPKETKFEEVRRAVESLGIQELTGIVPVEVFHGGADSAMAPDKYSLLLRVILQSQYATLTESDLAQHSRRIVECLEGTLGAQLRMQ